MNDGSVNYELKELERERVKGKAELITIQNQYAKLLQGQMGEDIKSVLNGKTLVRVSKKEKFLFKVKCFLKNLFERL